MDTSMDRRAFLGLSAMGALAAGAGLAQGDAAGE